MANGIEKLYNEPLLFQNLSNNAQARVRSQSSLHVTIEKEIYVMGKEENITYLDRRKQYSIELKNNFKFNNKSLSIYGSCVSRDLLEINKEKNFQIGEYFARTSIVSAVSEPLYIKEEEIHLDSNFQKRQVFNDLNKGVWQTFSNNKTDYLMIDFIDERFALGKIKESYFTISSEFIVSNTLSEEQYEKIVKVKRKDDYYIEDLPLSNYMKIFCDRLSEIYQSDHIILHKAFMADTYINKEGKVIKFDDNYLLANKKNNDLLTYMYDYMQERFPSMIIVESPVYCIANENHKWGLSPMHYIDNYYIDILNTLSNLL